MLFALLTLIACQPEQEYPEFDAIVRVQHAADGVEGAVDAIPSPAGDDLYFLTDGDASTAYVVTDDGPSALASFTGARSLAIGGDGWIYAADPVADGLYMASTDGSLPEVVPETSGFQPSAVHIGTAITLAGIDPTSGEPALWKIPGVGQNPESIVNTLHQEITGLAVASDGTIYAAGESRLYQIQNREVTLLGRDLLLGSPAGVALTPYEDAVMVSSYSNAGTPQLLVFDRETNDRYVINDGFEEMTGAGGLHRALEARETYAFVDPSGANGEGSVYTLTLE